MRTSAFLLAGILPLLLAAQAVPEAAQNAPLRKAFPRFRLDMGVGFGGTQNALGVYIKSQAGILRLREAWSGILMACLLGIGFYLIIVALERWLMPWHVSFRKDRAA